MEKIDARKLPRSALKEMRRQAMRMRQELQLSWKEIARVMGVSVGTVLAWSQRKAKPDWSPGSRDAPTCRGARSRRPRSGWCAPS